MNQTQGQGWLKHADFILIDMLCLQLSFVLAHWLIVAVDNPYRIDIHRYLAAVLFFAQIAVILFGSGYNGILRRGNLKEAGSVFRYAVSILLVTVVFLFMIRQSATVSRLQLGWTLVIYLAVDYIARTLR